MRCQSSANITPGAAEYNNDKGKQLKEILAGLDIPPPDGPLPLPSLTAQTIASCRNSACSLEGRILHPVRRHSGSEAGLSSQAIPPHAHHDTSSQVIFGQAGVLVMGSASYVLLVF
ncbi:hypothetical protein K503DRAFT_805994 [Rhizopogon vinicolor AM-OR11-026]|uniref:Uncharacterized protein n=1 Tax=Rhizopogon vinicolor AM-OR11-026 TaxID=1314800 RepID=A0A1B7MG08_9AGAM|nr:hypothetical protein K503DRAFT_805994 [Rhizopogon vinicolor AM-OR11-026]